MRGNSEWYFAQTKSDFKNQFKQFGSNTHSFKRRNHISKFVQPLSLLWKWVICFTDIWQRRSWSTSLGSCTTRRRATPEGPPRSYSGSDSNISGSSTIHLIRICFQGSRVRTWDEGAALQEAMRLRRPPLRGHQGIQASVLGRKLLLVMGWVKLGN